MTNNSWIVCQIGARENYTVPRALQKVGRLDTLLTDLWHEPTGFAGNLMSSGSMFQRWHADLANARVWAPNRSHLFFEALTRLRGGDDGGRHVTIRRNEHFQRRCVRYLQKQFPSAPSNPKTVFAFSYAARDIFQWAKARGHTTVLGQIDPGPFEEELVEQEHQLYPHTGSTWKPAPPAYWKNWREETALADFILVNSEWARQGLVSVGVPAHKIRLVPLFCEDEKKNLSSADHLRQARATAGDLPAPRDAPHLEILFLGNVCLRKGVARLIEAMRMLQDQPIRLSIYGPLSVSPSLWHGLPNVRWVGTIRNADIRQIYASADAFILPTISDGFARTQLEALASGTPILVSGHCGHVVLHGINGFLLEKNTPAEIAELLSVLSKERNLLAQCDTSRLPEDMPQSLDGLAHMLLNATK